MLTTQSVIKLTCFAVLSEVVYQFSRRIYKKLTRKITPDSLTYSLMQAYKSNKSPDNFNKVLFFPDSSLTCNRIVSGRVCRDRNCNALHDESSLSCLLNVLRFAKRTLDVCVYMITCNVLGDALVKCHERDVKVRVITEQRNSGEEGEVLGSQIGKLRAAGISVYCLSSSFWMHHKFMVADNEVLVNGSFNWTNQAVMGNYENLIITSEENLVEPFITEFQRLWDHLASAGDTKE